MKRLRRRVLLTMASSGLVLACNALVGIPGEEQRRSGAADGGDAAPVHDASHDARPDSDGPGLDTGNPHDAPMCPNDANPLVSCIACQDDHCCASADECLSSTSCPDYIDCVQGCDQGNASLYDSCVVACDPKEHEGHALYAKLDGCLVQNCNAPCNAVGDDPCDLCLNAKCLSATVACISSAGCDTAWSCTKLCLGDTKCQEVCEAHTSPSDMNLIAALELCYLDYCSSQCCPACRDG